MIDPLEQRRRSGGPRLVRLAEIIELALKCFLKEKLVIFKTSIYAICVIVQCHVEVRGLDSVSQ